MKINMQFFCKRTPIIIERDSLYLGQVYNNDTENSERKILFTIWFDGIEDVMFDSPNYCINDKIGYTVNNPVFLGSFLEELGYPSRLNNRDLRRIYSQLLSSTKAIYQNCRLFGVAKVEQGYKGNYTYLPFANIAGVIDHEIFYKLEELISLPVKPSNLEKQNEQYSFQKRLFFIP